MQRIVVLGCAGAGKTTFARRLGERTGRPIIVLDAIWPAFADGPRVEAFRAAIAEAHAGEAWVSDGNFAAATFDIRLPRADLIVWLDRPRWICAWRAVARVFQPGESHRPRDLRKALAFIWGFDRRNRPLIEAQRQAHGPDIPVVRLTSDREIDAFLDRIDLPAATAPAISAP